MVLLQEAFYDPAENQSPPEKSIHVHTKFSKQFQEVKKNDLMLIQGQESLSSQQGLLLNKVKERERFMSRMEKNQLVGKFKVKILTTKCQQR